MNAPRNTRIRYPGGSGAVSGIGAYLLGYLLTYTLVSARLRDVLARVIVARDGADVITLADALANAPLSTTKIAGVAFYNAHLVAAYVPNGDGGTVSMNLVRSAGGPYLALLLVPALLLVLAGVLVTKDASESTALRFDLGDYAWRRYAFNGGLIPTFGYLPFAAIGAIVFSVGYPPDSITIDLLYGWVLAGLV
jgi:hypothetical protein